MRSGRSALALAAALLCFAAAAPPEHGLRHRFDGEDPYAPIVDALRRFEAERRAATNFAALVPSDETQGADPYRVIPIPGTDTFAGILRGRDALVILDRNLREIARVTAPDSPSGVATDGRRIVATGELVPAITGWNTASGRPVAEFWSLSEQLLSARDVALGPEGAMYVLNAGENKLWVLEVHRYEHVEDLGIIEFGGVHHGDERDEAPTTTAIETRLQPREGLPDDGIPLPRGALRVARVGSHLVVNCLLDHCLLVYPLEPDGTPRYDFQRISHDGPLWCLHAVEDDQGLLIAAGGVENAPLDRSQGFFGNIDSFVYLYRVPHDARGKLAAPRLLTAVNVSELGVVTPKGIHLERVGRGTRVTVAGAGGFALATLSWPKEPAGVPATQVRPIPAGSADLVPAPGGWILPNPLLDAWVRVTADTFQIIEVPSLPRRDPLARLGEALFTTTLMAPANTTEGARSRFTCETCHFEGGGDGRVHWTGRDSVFASTKPLFGLFNNKPHFTRAMDPDLATMVHNEFRVAGAASGTDPWFPLRPRAFPGLELLGDLPETVSPDTLRLALMRYLMTLSPRKSLRIANWIHFDAERAGDARTVAGRGAAIFRDRCAGCHRARLVADDPSSEVPFTDWETLVNSPENPIVWASEELHRTGVEPYVREEGARVPSLRRLHLKYPYFTNGRAPTLEDVLARARWVGGTFFHDAAPAGLPAERLSDEEQAVLLTFLKLL